MGFFQVADQKIGVLRLHGYMPPRNSFPQICVVSVNIIVDDAQTLQEYLGSVTISNQIKSQLVIL